MKKLIIISGPQASGKTHIANAIAMQHNLGSIERIYFIEHFSRIKKETSLIIVEGVPKDKIEEYFGQISKVNSTANIVFTIQEVDVTHKEFGAIAHIINCRNVQL